MVQILKELNIKELKYCFSGIRQGVSPLLFTTWKTFPLTEGQYPNMSSYFLIILHSERQQQS